MKTLLATLLLTLFNLAPRQTFTGDGFALTYVFSFPISDKTEVEARINNFVQVGGFTVTMNADQINAPGGSVTFASAPALNSVVQLQRVKLFQQKTSLPAAGPFPPKQVERSMDSTVQMVQQVDRDRADLAAKEAADFLSVVNPSGTTLANNTLVTATGASVASVLADRFASVYNAHTDFGATGLGLVDDTAALQAAIDASKGKTVVIPHGTYLISSLTLIGTSYNHTRITFQNATLTCNSNGATECIKLDGTVGVEISGDVNLRPLGTNYVDTILILGGNRNRILAGMRIGYFDADAPAPFISDIAWGYYAGNSANGVHFKANTIGTEPLSFYNTVDGLSVKSINGFAIVIEATSATAIANNNIVRGLNARTHNCLKIIGGSGNQIDAEDLECTATGIYLDAVGATPALNNRINATWMEYAATPIFWGTATTGSKSNVIDIGNSSTMFAVPYFAVPRPGGTNNVLRQVAAGVNDFKVKWSSTENGAPVRMETTWAEDDALTYGAELWVDGNAEANSGSWTTVGSATQTQSNQQAHAGTFSRKVVTTAVAGGNGVKQTITTVPGTVYRWSFWIYLVAPGFDNYNGMNAFASNDNVGFWMSPEGQWFRVAMFMRAIGTSTVFQWEDLGSSAVTWYLDDVSVQAVTGGVTGHLAEWGEKFGQGPRAITGSINVDGSIGTTAILYTPVTFANIATYGTANFTVVPCSDCTIANPCAGGGTGAIAKRLNGAWVCN